MLAALLDGAMSQVGDTVTAVGCSADGTGSFVQGSAAAAVGVARPRSVPAFQVLKGTTMSEAPREQFRELVEQARSGDDLAFTMLEMLLDLSSPETVRESAAEALGALGDDRAVHMLTEVLVGRPDDGQPHIPGLGRTSRVKAAAARSLGRLGDDRAIPALEVALRAASVSSDRRDPDLRGELEAMERDMSTALGSLGDAGMRSLAALAKDHNLAAAVETLAADQKRDKPLNTEERDALAHAATSTSQSLAVRRSAISRLEKAGDPQFIDALQRLVPFDRDFVKARIRGLLKKRPPGGPFRPFLDDGAWASWLILAEDWKGVATIGQAAVGPLSRHIGAPLGAPCEHPTAALDALVEIGTPDAIDVLARATRGHTRAQMMEAAQRLTKIADSTTKRATAAALREEAAALRARWESYDWPSEVEDLRSGSESWDEVSEGTADRHQEEDRARSRAEACDRVADLLDPR